jgi:hypothetical protein
VRANPLKRSSVAASPDVKSDASPNFAVSGYCLSRSAIAAVSSGRLFAGPMRDAPIGRIWPPRPRKLS